MSARASDFWSRRRASVEAEAAAQKASEAAARAAGEEARQEALSDEELLAEAGLPDPETLDSPEQVQAFLRSALPQRLKTRALRKLWRMNPVLANLDGLVDYADDYTDAATVVENLQTVYQVGKGMIDRVAEVAAEPKPDAGNTAAEPAADETEAPELAGTDPAAETPAPDMAETSTAPARPEPGNAPDHVVAAPRRMRFHFET